MNSPHPPVPCLPFESGRMIRIDLNESKQLAHGRGNRPIRLSRAPKRQSVRVLLHSSRLVSTREIAVSAEVATYTEIVTAFPYRVTRHFNHLQTAS